MGLEKTDLLKGNLGNRNLNGTIGAVKGDKGDTGPKGDKGDSGEKGDKGLKGDKGDKGDAFEYSDFTEEQLAALKGPKGDKGDSGEKGDKGLKGDKGDKGDAFEYSDFTEEQLAALKGPKGDKGDSGDKGAPLSYSDLTEAQKTDLIKDVVEHKHFLKTTSAVAKGGTITIPCNYKVGTGCLDVFYMGELLTLSSDDAGTNGHYREIGENNSISNQIKTTSDWGCEAGEYFEFVVRGDYSG